MAKINISKSKQRDFPNQIDEDLDFKALES